MPPKKRQRVVAPTPPPLESPQSDNDDEEMFLFILHIFASFPLRALSWGDLFAPPRDFLLHSQSEINIPYLEFTSIEYDSATTALNSSSSVVSHNILNKMLEFKHLMGRFPLLAELVSSLVEETNAPSALHEVYTNWIVERGFIHSVRISTKIQEYFARYRVYPTDDQLRVFVLTPPTIGVSEESLLGLPRYPNANCEAVCTICHTDIKLSLTVLKLPCNHVFHANGQDCLPSQEGEEGHSILTWLAQSNKCPLCKAIV